MPNGAISIREAALRHTRSIEVNMIPKFRRRPTFRFDDLLLHKGTGELSYLPDEFAPHTIMLLKPRENKYEFDFEYSIDESADDPKNFGIVSFTFGKYS